MGDHHHLPFVTSNADNSDGVASETDRDVSVNRDTEARNNPSNLGVVRALDLVTAELILGAALTRTIGYALTRNQKKKITVEKNSPGRSSENASNESSNNEEGLREHFRGLLA